MCIRDRRETARYVKLPQIIDFTDKDGNDRMQEEIQANYEVACGCLHLKKLFHHEAHNHTCIIWGTVAA